MRTAPQREHRREERPRQPTNICEPACAVEMDLEDLEVNSVDSRELAGHGCDNQGYWRWCL